MTPNLGLIKLAIIATITTAYKGVSARIKPDMYLNSKKKKANPIKLNSRAFAFIDDLKN
jgi:hypothetical protein